MYTLHAFMEIQAEIEYERYVGTIVLLGREAVQCWSGTR